MQQSEIKQTVSQLFRNKSKLDFDLEVQRKEVWDKERKCLFIHTLLSNYPFPVVYAVKNEDDSLSFLDGKQRLTTVLGYLQEGFRLSKDTPPVKLDGEDVEIADKFFSELPEEFQEDIKSSNFTIVQLEHATDEEIATCFLRLNNGVALRSIELLRSQMLPQVLHFVQGVSQEHFFAEAANLAKASKNRFVDEELILQIVALLYNNGEAVKFNKAGMEEFVEQLNKQGGISQEIHDIMTKTTHYLNEAFPVRDKMLKKVHIPMIFIQATKAMEMGIEPVKFAGWLQGFMSDMPSRYSSSSTGGTTKIENVSTRLREMSEHFEKNVKRAKLYVAPQDQQKSTRGKKSKQEAVTA